MNISLKNVNHLLINTTEVNCIPFITTEFESER